jgi:hypothetical protein
LNIFYISNFFLEKFGMKLPFTVLLCYQSSSEHGSLGPQMLEFNWFLDLAILVLQNCGVMKISGRHALLSRGWGKRKNAV